MTDAHPQTAPRGAALIDSLALAIKHIEHMAAWIASQNAGYSFESLGEDMPGIKAALALPKTDELPDDIRVPLHELQADMDYLFGRVAADGSCASAMSSSVKAKLAALEVAILALLPASESEWQPIESASKNRQPILVKFYDDIYPRLRPERNDLERWNGVQFVARHPGLAEDGFDVGWGFAAPVGTGGFPDEWIEGWKPLDAPPTTALASKGSQAADKSGGAA